MKCIRLLPTLIAFCIAGIGIANAQKITVSQKPVSQSNKEAVETDPTTSKGFGIVSNASGLTITVDGQLFSRYVIDKVNKPYLWPIIGPTGQPMTRAYPMELLESEKEQRDHPHHRGLLFGHENAGLVGWKYPDSDKEWTAIKKKDRPFAGGDTWHELATFEDYQKMPKRAVDGHRRPDTLASIKHREFKQLVIEGDQAIVVELCDHVDRDGKRFMSEERRLVFRSSETSRSIDFDQTFTAEDGDIFFDDRKDAGLGIRVPTSMAIDSKKGGTVINSDGLIDGKAWSKPAKWCDYNGPVEGEHLGIAFLNHPNSYRFPTRWHVREYGLFTANPFAMKAFSSKLEDGTTILKQGESLNLKHRLIFHAGDATTANIEQAWQQYAKEDTNHESK
ncbi:MAG: PmoA family protein [Mariniblastus sp.]